MLSVIALLADNMSVIIMSVELSSSCRLSLQASNKKVLNVWQERRAL